VRRRGAWTADELGAFLEASADTRLEAAWHLLADAGMRVGEVLAVRWADVDAENGRINVGDAVVGVPYSVLVAPLAAPGARVIAASPDLLDALRRHRRRQDAERSEWDCHFRDADLIVCREDGRPLHPRALHQAFRRRIAATGMPVIALADLCRSDGRRAPREAVVV